MYQKAQANYSGSNSTLGRVCLLLVFAISSIEAGPVSALTASTSLPASRVIGTLSLGLGAFALVPPVSVDTFGLFRSEFEEPPTTSAGAELFIAPTPAPYMVATAGDGPGLNSQAQGTLIYSMQIAGPPGPVPVFFLAIAHVFTDVDANASGHAHAGWSLIDLSLSGGPTIFSEELTAGPGTFSDGFNHVRGLILTANDVYRVTMVAEASATGGEFGASAQALIDPVFSFAPEADPGYSFVFSDGIGNTVAAAPEPGTIGLLGAGVMVVGWWRRLGGRR